MIRLTSIESESVAHANSEGFSIVTDVFSDQECEHFSNLLSATAEGRGRAGTRHLMSNPFVATLASDNRLLEVASQSLGTQAIPYRATLFEKTSRANWLVVWHQDTALPLSSFTDSQEWGPWSTKNGILYAHAPSWALSRIIALRIHLDGSTTHNGPLRIIPGSHLKGVLADDEVFRIARTNTAVECIVPRGSVLAMRPLLIHSSSKAINDLPRRVLHIEYTDSLDLRSEIRLAMS